MPRKGKNKEKNTDSKRENIEELSSLFKNAQKSEEENLEEHEKESELEEDVGDSNLNLQNLEFHQFMQPNRNSTTSSPVLERIAGSVPRPIFVGTARGAEASSDVSDSKGEFGYVTGVEGRSEPKYFAEPGAENAAERVDFTQAGRTNSFREEISQERFFRQSEQKVDSPNVESFQRVRRFDFENTERRSSFERPEEKYEKYKPKTPK